MSQAAQPARLLTRDEALDAVRAGATLVTGNDRLARGLREAFNAKMVAAGAKAWPSPRIHSWNVWMDRLWEELERRSSDPPVRLSANQELILWAQAIERDPGRSDLLAVHATAEAAREAATLALEWRLPIAQLAASPLVEVQSFLRWRQDVERRCASQAWTSTAAAVDLLIEGLSAAAPADVILAGCDELSPQQQELLDAVRNGGRVRKMAPSPPAAPRNARVELESPRVEMRAAARWAKRLLDEGSRGPIGVAVANLSARRQQVERAFLEEFAESALLLDGESDPGFTISAGLPLDRYALVHAALLALQLDPDGTELATFGAWLRCQAIAGGERERHARGVLDRLLRDKKLAHIRPHGLGRELLKALPELSRALRAWKRRYSKLPQRQSAPAWADAFSRLLDVLGWPGEAAASNESRQALERWNTLLAELASLGAAAEEWDMATAHHTLARMARATTFQPEAASAPVEVMSLPESTGAELEHLWVAGLDDETWPAEPNPNPFLPLELQREHKLPHASVERELEMAALETERLRAGAPNVVFSHAAKVEEREVKPSPLIARIGAISPEQVAGPPRETLARRIWAAARAERIADAEGPPAPAGEVLPGGAAIFKHQAHCPFRAFAEFRLGARALETASSGLAPTERGQLVHDALECIWGDLRSSRELRSRNPGALRETVKAGVNQAIATLADRRRSPLPTRFERVERERLEELLLDWLATERDARSDDFETVELENKKVIAIGGLMAKVRVDRVDALADGRRIILDYKTGKTAPAEWDKVRSLEPQIPLYAVSHEGELGGAVFAKLCADETKFEGATAPDVRIRGAGKNGDPELSERVDQWRRNLEALAKDFLAGRAEVDPRDGKCEHCKLPALCRKDEPL